MVLYNFVIWSALIYKKYKFSNLKFLIYFSIIFIILGFLPSYFLSADFDNIRGPFGHIFGTSPDSFFSITEFIKTFFINLVISFKIIGYTEYIFILFIILSIFYLSKNYNNKNNFIIISILFLEPILIFSLSSGVVIQLRYLSGLICLMYILIAIMINDLNTSKYFKKILIIFFILNTSLASIKLVDQNKIDQIMKNNHSFYDFYFSNNDLNQSTLYFSNEFYFRSNLKDLCFIEICIIKINRNYSLRKIILKLCFK